MQNSTLSLGVLDMDRLMNVTNLLMEGFEEEARLVTVEEVRLWQGDVPATPPRSKGLGELFVCRFVCPTRVRPLFFFVGRSTDDVQGSFCEQEKH